MFNLTTTICFIYIGLTVAIGVNYVVNNIHQFNDIYENDETENTKNQ